MFVCIRRCEWQLERPGVVCECDYFASETYQFVWCGECSSLNELVNSVTDLSSCLFFLLYLCECKDLGSKGDFSDVANHPIG